METYFEHTTHGLYSGSWKYIIDNVVTDLTKHFKREIDSRDEKITILQRAVDIKCNKITNTLKQVDGLYEENDNLKLDNAELSDDVKDLEEKYSRTIEENCKWRESAIEYSKIIEGLKKENAALVLSNTRLCVGSRAHPCEAREYREEVRRLTNENEELAESKAKLESMLDLCESSCSECKKPVEIENLETRITDLENKLACKERLIKILSNKLNAARLTIMDLQSGKAYWQDKYVAQVDYCLNKCPRVPPQ